jgi:capsid protein
MNSQKDQEERKIFEGRIHTGVMQDKYPPGRITAGSSQPATATVVADLTPRVSTKQARSQNQTSPHADNRPKHHGSETRQTLQIAGRVSPAVKSEIVRLAKLKGWTESRTVAALVEAAIAGNLAEQFGVMLKATLQEAVTTQMQKENNKAGNLALEAFYSAEESRVLVVYLIRLFLGSDIDVLPQIIKDAQDQARENVSMAVHTRRKQN